MIRRPPRSTQSRSSAASDVYKRQQEVHEDHLVGAGGALTMAKIKKGDLVVIITGRDRGKQGRVLEVLKDSDRLVVEGVQRVTKHVRAGQTSRGTRTGGIETLEAPIHISNVMLVDPETKKGTRVGHRTEEIECDGRTRTVRVRVAKRSGKDIA